MGKENLTPQDLEPGSVCAYDRRKRQSNLP